MKNIAIVFFCASYFIAASESIGDLRLVGNGATYSAGRLEIFLGSNHGWGTVSHRTFNQRTADVACRQLGFDGADNFGLALNSSFGVGDSLWTFLNDSRCTGDELHLLRCRWKGGPCRDCDHSEDIAIECNSAAVWTTPYEGQVRLLGPYPSKGIVQVYLKQEWGTVCGDSATSAQANSICEQLGYTNSNGLDFHEYSGKVWLKVFHCQESQPCFSNCYYYTDVGKDWTEDCTTGSLVVSCEFVFGGFRDTSVSRCRWDLPNDTTTTQPTLPTQGSVTWSKVDPFPIAMRSVEEVSLKITLEPATVDIATQQSLMSPSAMLPAPASEIGCTESAMDLVVMSSNCDETTQATAVPLTNHFLTQSPTSVQELVSTKAMHTVTAVTTNSDTHLHLTSVAAQPSSISMMPILVQTTVAHDAGPSHGSTAETSSTVVNPTLTSVVETSPENTIHLTSVVTTSAQMATSTIDESSDVHTNTVMASLGAASTSLVVAITSLKPVSTVTRRTETELTASLLIQTTPVLAETSTSAYLHSSYQLSSLLSPAAMTASIIAPSLSFVYVSATSEHMPSSTSSSTDRPSNSTSTVTPVHPPSDTPFTTNDIVAMALGSFGLLLLLSMLLFMAVYTCVWFKPCCGRAHTKKDASSSHYPGFY